MRTSLSIVILACLAWPSRAGAQAAQVPPPAPTPSTESSTEPQGNVAEFTVRGTSYDAGSDQARYQRYRDLRNGGTLDLFRFTRATDSQ
jgi:hypothetical protein